ncbi:DUF2235 domain-containing protein [Pseudomonas sp. SIMBA_077]
MGDSSNPMRRLRVGIFFDGTANNQFNSAAGLKRLAQGLRVEADSSYASAPTNIAKLHQHYPAQQSFDADGYAVTSLYISGIGTTTGAADTRFPAQTFGLGSHGVVSKAEQAYAQLLECLTYFLREPDALNHVHLDIFGFSRGAAAARHFANLINTRSFKSQLAVAADIECVIGFIGLFDTVAAMGGLTDGGDISDSYNPGLDLYLSPECAHHVVQLAARDEQRRNYSLNRITPQWPMDISVPGVHADVGGGYPALMSEQVFLSRWHTNRVSSSTPIMLTQAWQNASAELADWQARDLLDPDDQDCLLQVRTDSRREGSRDDPMRQVMAAVFMRRRVWGDLSRVYLRIMHSLAREQGVPFSALSEADSALPAELLPIEAKLQTQVRLGVVDLTDEDERVLRQRYIHQSANWNASLGSGVGVIEQGFFNRPQAGGRLLHEQQVPVFG